MDLIADSGSTKTDWQLVNNGDILQFTSGGLNPDFNTEETVYKITLEAFKSIDSSTVSNVYFYGSGCSSPRRNQIVVEGLKKVFPSAQLFVWHDLLGAARAACGNSRGLAGIMGTGSNCSFYDGKEITKEFRSGGYVIGDEGGGVYLGKKLIKAFIEESLPKEISESFIQRYGYNTDDILYKLYKEDYPNRFLASFSKFISDHKAHPFIDQLIYDSIEDYFDIKVCRFEEHREVSLNIVGSIAFYYEDFIRKVASSKQVTIGTILEKPITGLIKYHTELA